VVLGGQVTELLDLDALLAGARREARQPAVGAPEPAEV
jgi:hypothetical protein